MDIARKLVLAGIFGLVALPAGADMTTQSRSIGPTQTDWDRGVSFDPFNAALGTLVNETLIAKLKTQSEFEADFTASSTITLSAGPTVVDVGGLLKLETPKAERTATDSDTTIQFADAVNFDSAQLDIAPNPGGLVLPITARGASSFTSDTGNGTGNVRTLAGVDLYLEYRYLPFVCPQPPTAVPEPSSMALALGAVALTTTCLVGRTLLRAR